jgi:uncharacterized protein YceK
MHINDSNFSGSAYGDSAIENLTSLAKEKEKTRRLLLILATIILIFGCSSILFAPQNKEMESMIIGAVMIVLSLGAVGASSFKVKMPSFEISTNDNTRNLVDSKTTIQEDQFSNHRAS